MAKPASPGSDDGAPAAEASGRGAIRRSGAMRRAGRGAAGLVRGAALGIIGFLLMALIVAGIAAVTLRERPITLPGVADLVAERVNETRGVARIEIGSAVLVLGRRDGAPALRLRDVSLFSQTGSPLVSVPELGIRFSIPDLIEGRIRPTRIAIRGPEVLFVRGIDGRWRFGLGSGGFGGGLDLGGDGPEVATGTPDEAAPKDAGQEGYAAFAATLDALAGETPPMPELEKLEALVIRDATLGYRNAATGEVWKTEHATLRIRRDRLGLTGAIGVRLAGGDEAPLRTIRIAVGRERGANETAVDASLTGIRPSRLALDFPELDWLRLIDAPVDGIINGTLRDDGRIGAFSGRIEAGEGRFVGLEGRVLGAEGFTSFGTSFAYEPEGERLTIREAQLEAAMGSVTLSGIVDLERGAEGDLAGLAGQLDIRDLALDMPGVFAGPIAFESGSVVARLGFGDQPIEIASARLDMGTMSLDLSGDLWPRPDGWATDLRVEGRSISVNQLKAHWPVSAAGNARDWVVEHLEEGMVDRMVAQLRMGEGEPQISVDFRFRDVVSRYLDDMPAIRNAHGRGHLRLNEFLLEMDRGHVEPVDGQRIALDGSHVRVSDLWAPVTPGDITIRGAGPLRAILVLIDQPPLRLVSKLGLDPSALMGEATVTTELAFPLIDDLLLEEISADASASVEGFAFRLEGPGGRALPLSEGALTLEASTTEMTVAGEVLADGIPTELTWREIYGETPGRRHLLARFEATPERLARLGLEQDVFVAGRAPSVVRLAQTGSAPPEIALEADLAPAALRLARLGWSKPEGAAGRAEVEATTREGGGLRVSALRLSAPGLEAQGTLEIDSTGALARADLAQVQLGERADLALEATRVDGDGLALTLRGELLDLSAFETGLAEEGAAGDGATGGGAPAAAPADDLPAFTVDFDLSRVVLTPSLAVHGARGQLRSAAAGGLAADLGGALNGEAPVDLRITLPEAADGTLRLQSEDAGGVLRATGLAESARGGSLDLDARLLGGSLDRIDGTLTMRSITLREARTFEQILTQGGVRETVEVSGGGLGFSRVQIPFRYEGGTITLGTSIATSPSLAVKLDGTIEEESGALDLSGVISPAYAISGALNDIPLLGAILTGGKGEGILAMTFSVSGTVDDPSYTVNPLSLLTPGFLRRIFTGKAEKPDERFLEGLRPMD